MKIRHRHTPELALSAGQVLTLDDAEGVRIASRGGIVWVTQEGSLKDYIVGPGDALVVTSSGRTVVQALQAARIAILKAAANDSWAV